MLLDIIIDVDYKTVKTLNFGNTVDVDSAKT